jgi:hypothetical protein
MCFDERLLGAVIVIYATDQLVRALMMKIAFTLFNDALSNAAVINLDRETTS